MATDPISAWQQEALDKMSARLREWIPDPQLHLLLIRAPFHHPGTKVELTDPAFERLLQADPAAAQSQLQAESLADQIATAHRDRRRQQTRQANAEAAQAFASAKQRSRARRRAQPHSHEQQSIPLP